MVEWKNGCAWGRTPKSLKGFLPASTVLSAVFNANSICFRKLFPFFVFEDTALDWYSYLHGHFSVSYDASSLCLAVTRIASSEACHPLVLFPPWQHVPVSHWVTVVRFCVSHCTSVEPVVPWVLLMTKHVLGQCFCKVCHLQRSWGRKKPWIFGKVEKKKGYVLEWRDRRV